MLSTLTAITVLFLLVFQICAFGNLPGFHRGDDPQDDIGKDRQTGENAQDESDDTDQQWIEVVIRAMPPQTPPQHPVVTAAVKPFFDSRGWGLLLPDGVRGGLTDGFAELFGTAQDGNSVAYGASRLTT